MKTKEGIKIAPLVWTNFFHLSSLCIQWHTMQNQKTEHKS